jgi:RNA recognition motif-containing protein
MNIHVINIDLNLGENDLQRLFKKYGEIRSILILRDSLNNRSRGRALIEMPVDKEAENAIAGLNGFLAGKKKLVVTGAKYQEENH